MILNLTDREWNVRRASIALTRLGVVLQDELSPIDEVVFKALDRRLHDWYGWSLVRLKGNWRP